MRRIGLVDTLEYRLQVYCAEKVKQKKKRARLFCALNDPYGLKGLYVNEASLSGILLSLYLASNQLDTVIFVFYL